MSASLVLLDVQKSVEEKKKNSAAWQTSSNRLIILSKSLSHSNASRIQCREKRDNSPNWKLYINGVDESVYGFYIFCQVLLCRFPDLLKLVTIW